MENIAEYIDMPIIEFIKKVSSKSFTEMTGMTKLMDMEVSRIAQFRNLMLHKLVEFDADSKEFECTFSKYISTFVIEQRIVDRNSILKYLSSMKDLENCSSIFSRSEVGRTSESLLHSEVGRTCKSPKM